MKHFKYCFVVLVIVLISLCSLVSCENASDYINGSEVTIIEPSFDTATGEEKELIEAKIEITQYKIKMVPAWKPADYGVPTTRRRLFIQAAKAGKKIIWPEPTYSEKGGTLPRWKAAKDIIDWSIPCPSIRNRKKPLAPATMRRIEYGIKKYWKDSSIRAIKTMAQTAVSLIGTNTVGITEVDWIAVLSVSALAGIVSLLMSVVNMPTEEE